MESGAPQVIPNQMGARTTPSVVGFTPKGERLIGTAAMPRAPSNIRNTIYGVKRLMGRKYDSTEVSRARHLLPYELEGAANGDAHVKVGDRTYSPPEVASLVLGRLKAA